VLNKTFWSKYEGSMLLYDLLDTLEPFREVTIESVNSDRWDKINISIGQDYKGNFGWCYYCYSVLDVYRCSTPQDNSRHSERNTSGLAYTVVYKRWKCLINKIKCDFKNIECKLI